MADPTQFEIQGHAFSVEPLDLDKNLRLFALVAPVLSLLAAANNRQPGDAGESPEHIVSALSALPEIFHMFERVTKVRAKGAAVDMPLKAMSGELFQRRSALMVGYLVQCIKGELSDFLDGGHGLTDVLEMAKG